MKQEITGHTALYCLLGSPVAHSISPQMHNASFLHHGIDARYLAFDVKPNSWRMRSMDSRQSVSEDLT